MRCIPACKCSCLKMAVQVNSFFIYSHCQLTFFYSGTLYVKWFPYHLSVFMLILEMRFSVHCSGFLLLIINNTFRGKLLFSIGEYYFFIDSKENTQESRKVRKKSIIHPQSLCFLDI